MKRIIVFILLLLSSVFAQAATGDSSPVNVASSETLRAIGTEDGYIYDSAIVNASYIITSISGSSAVIFASVTEGNFKVTANAVIQ